MSQINIKNEKTLQFVTILIFSVFTIFLAVSYSNVQQDDSYITYTYAKNIIDGKGYVFNEGERVNASTSTLYTLTLVLVYSALQWIPFVSLPVTGHFIGAICLWATVFFFMKLFRDVGLKMVALIFPIFFLSIPLLKNAIGMETFLTLALIALSLYLYNREKILLFSVVCALAVLSRPDSIILPFVLFVDYIIQKRKLPPVASFVIFHWF